MAVRVTDNFNRADASPLGSPWSTPTGGGGGFKIVSNQVLGVTPSGDNFTHYDNDSPPADHYCKIKFVSTENTGGDSDDGGPCVRFTTGGNGYLFNVADNFPLNDCTWWLFSLVAGAGTVLNAGAATGTLGHRLTTLDIIECRCVGSTISGWINSVQIASATDTLYASGGGYGLHAFEGGALNGKWDDFEGGDFIVGGTVNLGTSFHPGRSPGLGGISSARFQPSNWWPYSPPAIVTFDPALMIAMEKHGNDPLVLPPQVVASGMTPPEEMPT